MYMYNPLNNVLSNWGNGANNTMTLFEPNQTRESESEETVKKGWPRKTKLMMSNAVRTQHKAKRDRAKTK